MHHSRIFFDRKRADAFASYLEAQGASDVQIWLGTDAFGQTQYSVRWYID